MVVLAGCPAVAVSDHCAVPEALENGRFAGFCCRDAVGAFVFPDVGNEAHKVVVEVAAAHHLNVAAEFVVGAVDKHEGPVLGTLPTACNPLVPACDQNNRRVGFEGALELLDEVVALCVGVGLCVIGAFVPGSAAVGGLAVHYAVAKADLRVLGNGHVDALRDAVKVLENSLGLLKVHPGPAAALCGLIGPLGKLDCKERLCFLVALLGDGYDDGLAANLKPRLLVKTGLVELVVDPADGLAGERVGVEHHLGNFEAVLGVFLKDAHDDVADVLVDDRIGGVKEKKVDVGLHDELHVAPDDPLVCHRIVAVERLAPVMHLADAAPHGIVDLETRLGVRIGDLRHVEKTLVALAEPKKIEQTDSAVVAPRRKLLRGGDCPSESVCAADGPVWILKIAHKIPP